MLTEQQKARIVELAQEQELRLAWNGGQDKTARKPFVSAMARQCSAEAFRIAQEAAQ